MHTGRCECGKVRFEVKNARETVNVCHCSQCRRVSGHIWAATRARFEDVNFLSDATLAWYQSSDHAKRGFCSACGSSLFYRMIGEDSVGIAAGSLDAPTRLKVSRHIFVKDKGDYYDICDSAEQLQKY